jgi:hypothetical protein
LELRDWEIRKGRLSRKLDTAEKTCSNQYKKVTTTADSAYREHGFSIIL